MFPTPFLVVVFSMQKFLFWLHEKHQSHAGFCHALFPPPAAVFFYVEREMVHGEVLPDCTPSATPNFLRAKPPQ